MAHIKTAQWVLNESDAGPFSRQPHPTRDEPMPRNFDQRKADAAFERSWFVRDRYRLIEEAPQPWSSVQRERDDSLALDDGEEAVIEPLDPEDCYAGGHGAAFLR